MPNIPLIPEFGGMLVGFMWDMTVSEGATHTNDLAEHPVEDPSRSFAMDYNRVKPNTLKVTLQVSDNPTHALIDLGPLRITLFYELLLRLRAQQSTTPSALLTVFTGVKVHRNMAITSISMDRKDESSNVATFTIDLREARFATSPVAYNTRYPMDANRGPVANTGKTAVSLENRCVVEATSQRSNARLGAVTTDQTSQIRHSMRNDPDIRLAQ